MKAVPRNSGEACGCIVQIGPLRRRQIPRQCKNGTFTATGQAGLVVQEPQIELKTKVHTQENNVVKVISKVVAFSQHWRLKWLNSRSPKL